MYSKDIPTMIPWLITLLVTNILVTKITNIRKNNKSSLVKNKKK